MLKISKNTKITNLRKNENTEDDLNHYGLRVKSMGRNYQQDREFFDAASNAAYYLMEVCDDSRRTNNK